MAVELKIPTAGESITEVQIGQWLVREGDFVERDQPVVELETDKASMELPAPVAGRIEKILHGDGEILPVGEVIAIIDETATGAAAGAGGATQTAAEGAAEASQSATTATQAPPTDDVPVMPAARALMAEHGLTPADVQGTGPGGRILKEDVLRALAMRSPGAPAATAPGAAPAPGGSDVSARGEAEDSRGRPSPTTRQDQGAGSARTARVPVTPAPAESVPTAREEEVVPMTMLRRRIAEKLVEAKRTAALLTTFNEIDMSQVIALRKQYQPAFEKKYGIKLGFMSFFVKAAIEALKQFPVVNAEVRGTDIVFKNYYDIGVAVSTEHGLVVPVLRDADRMSFAEVELAIADLARRARERKLSVEELTGGTFTISNGGVFGSLLSTPIVNPPQSAILGLHAIQDRPVVRDGQIVIRPMMYVALTYDHRIIDGRESVSFLRRIKECIEDPARILIEV